MGKINILILEDTPEVPGKGYEYINKFKKYYEDEKQEATITAITKKSDYQNISTLIQDNSYHIAILDYVLELFKTDSNGWIHIEKILEKNPYCNIVLVTALDTIQKDVDKLPDNIKELISKRINIKYIPKDSNFTNRIDRYIEELINNLKSRWLLQTQIIKCAIQSFEALMDRSIGTLIEKSDIHGKEDTMTLDLITEIKIRDMFVPYIHEHKIVICTEEGGVENKVIYRIDRPVFYIFSDPFDGSSAMKKWINETSMSLSEDLLNTTIPSALSDFCKIDKISQSIIFKVSSEFEKYKDVLIKADSSEKWQRVINKLSSEIIKKMNKKLNEVIQDTKEIKKWEERYGPKQLNSPMISIVLTERHHVVGNVLINLFTKDLYFSNDKGNYKTTIEDYKNNESPKGLVFRKSYVTNTDKLLLCTMEYEKYEDKRKGKPQDFPFHMHFRECIQPLIPYDYNLEKSFEKRKVRHDFTPGPGRILFLSEVAKNYSDEVEDGQKELYSCILSSGEPLTEWVGWFAFLRHLPHISAYCLRSGKGNICQHQVQRDNLKGTMLPPEVACRVSAKIPS